MAKFIISGQAKLKGKVNISGAKNAALKLLAGSILGNGKSVIHNVPRIIDIEKVEGILNKLGTKVSLSNHTVSINPNTIKTHILDRDLTKKLRGSIVFAGPMLAKFGKVTFAQPGGCLIGARNIDDHLDLFKQLGVKTQQKGEIFQLSGKPKAGEVVLSKMSVTATENAIMATVLSPGTTKIHIAAAEPEIIDLSNYLNKMGAKISGAGTHDITVTGVKSLKGATYSVMPDRIEASTYLIAGLITNSEIEISPVNPDHMKLVLSKLIQAGGKFTIQKDNSQFSIKTLKHGVLKSVDIDTRPYPGFPTDLQSQYAIFATQSVGVSRIFETLFESRFNYLKELKMMGAKIKVESPHIISVYGKSNLVGKKINALDIRGGAALVLAALVAKGKTTITNIELIERGFESIDKKLKNLGLDIKVIRK